MPEPAPGSILVVRHGPGRGRMPGYLAQVVASLEDREPTLFARLRFHETGTAEPSLVGVVAVVFWLGDPLRELYPACYAEADAIAKAARRAGARVVNPPDALSNSIKSVQARRWEEAGIPTPRQLRFETVGELHRVAGRVAYPAIVRGDELHGQAGMRFCSDADAVRALAAADLSLPGAIVPFVDVRAGRSRQDLRRVWFHKRRALVLGSVVQPVHEFFSDEPFVSANRSTFKLREKPGRKPLVGLRAWPYQRAFVREDVEYFYGGEPHHDLLTRAAAALELDFVAIDYSMLGDGSPVLWEANPHFGLPPWNANVLPRARRLEERHARLHEAFVRFFEGLAG